MVVAEMSQERADKYRRKAEEYRLKALKSPARLRQGGMAQAGRGLAAARRHGAESERA